MLTREDSEKLKAHLVAVRFKPCPECGGTFFTFVGPLALPVYSPLAVSLRGDMDAMLIIKVVCGACFGSREFAWQPIVDPPREEKSPAHLSLVPAS